MGSEREGQESCPPFGCLQWLCRWSLRPLFNDGNPCRNPTLRSADGWIRNGRRRSVVVQIVLGPEGSDSVEVVSGHRKAEQYRHLHLAEHAKEAPSEIDKRPLEGGVDRFHYLSASHGYSPRGRAEGNSLVKCELSRCDSESARTAPIYICADVDEGRSARASHGLRKLPAAKEAGAKRAAPAGDTIRVRSGVTDQPPACPLVKFGLLSLLLPLRCTTWRHREVSQVLWQMG
jgi:hypothetical protein